MSLEKRIWHLGTFITILLVLISTRIVYWQIVRAADLQPVAIDLIAAGDVYGRDPENGEDDVQEQAEDVIGGRRPVRIEDLPQPVIQRTRELLSSITRGNITDRNGRLLATDRQGPEGERLRVYTEPSLGHVTGYVSGIRTGATGLELTFNPTLLGLNRPDSRLDQITHQPIVGTDLILTIDSYVQRVAVQALGGQTGAVVVLDGKTGAVLAMASNPYFDPNQILNQDYAAGLLAGNAPLLNRATQALYSPGSTWKTVTLLAALDSGQVTPETVFDFGKARQGPDGPYYVYEVDGGVIPDPNHKESKLVLPMAYARSANAAFARMGHEMQPETLIRYAGRLGFGEPGHDTFRFALPVAPSQIANDLNSIRTNNLLRAVTAIGQGELLVTPLNMAMLPLVALNNGDMPLPYVIESLQAPGAAPRPAPLRGQVERGIVKPETARQVYDMMITVVKEGSGKRADVQGATVGGKTGTAQLGGDQAPHAWFMGFADTGERSVAIAVIIEHGNSGFAVAAPVFAQVANAALFHLGEGVEEVVPLPPPLPVPGQQAPGEANQPQAVPPGGQQPVAPVVQARPVELTWEAARVGSNLGGQGVCRAENLPPAPTTPGSGQFQWPSPYHTQGLGGDEFKAGHPGIDLAAVEGSPVMASDSGQVVFAGWSEAGYGNAVVIDHGNGYQTLYGHLSQVQTACGAQVAVGDKIGLSGATGKVRGPHLHFEIRVAEGFINPAPLLPPP